MSVRMDKHHDHYQYYLTLQIGTVTTYQQLLLSLLDFVGIDSLNGPLFAFFTAACWVWYSDVDGE